MYEICAITIFLSKCSGICKNYWQKLSKKKLSIHSSQLVPSNGNFKFGMDSFIHSFICSSIRPFVCSVYHPLLCAFIRSSSVRMFFRSFIHSSIISLICSFVRSFSQIYLFGFRSLVRSFNHNHEFNHNHISDQSMRELDFHTMRFLKGIFLRLVARRLLEERN